MSCQTLMVPSWPGSFFTSEPAMSQRKPSQPRSSQNAMTSFMAWRVASASGASMALCQGSVTSAKP